jgi:DDE family transposase
VREEKRLVAGNLLIGSLLPGGTPMKAATTPRLLWGWSIQARSLPSCMYAQRPHDADLLISAIEIHAAKLGRVPRLVAADAGFHSNQNQAAARARGVKRVCTPDHSSKSPSRKREQKKRWFRNGQRWRTGCEGRISVSKRRHGLQRCRYRGDDGMKRWVGLGIIADNLINIGRFAVAQSDA